MKVRKSLSRRLITRIFLVSSLFTLLMTLIQLVIDYKVERNSVEETFSIIEKSSLTSLSKALWDLNDSSLKLDLEGIRSLPYVEYVELKEGEKILLVRGEKVDSPRETREIPIHYTSQGKTQLLGVLTVVVDLSKIYERVFERVFVVFVTQLLKTLFVTSIVYLIIFQLLTQHLTKISDYLLGLDLSGSGQDCVLNRKPSKKGSEDEFDVLVSVMNDLRKKLTFSYLKVKEMNAVLDSQVEEKTHQLSEAQAQLINAAKFSALGEMAGGIAHEINTPLAAITLMAESMQDSLAEPHFKKEALHQNLDRMIGTVERIAKIINGLRSFSRDGGADPLTEVAVHVLVEDTASLCREKLKSMKIDLQIPPVEENLSLLCRPSQISQVLINLIGNSADAIQESPQKWIRLEVTRTEKEILISVTDSGPAIDQAIVEKIFQPFFTTKKIGKGTGLGLSISKGIMEIHRGRLEYDAASPNAKFVLRMPPAKPALRIA